MLGAGLGLAITIQLYPDTARTSTLGTRNFPARDPSLTQLPTLQLGTGGGGGGGGGGAGGAGGGGGGAGAAGGGAGTPGARFHKPPRGETRFDPHRIILESEASPDVLEGIAQQHNMTREETVRIALIGRTIHVWRINGTTTVLNMIDNVAIHSGIITGAQPLYFHALAQRGQTQATAEQYAPQKLHLAEAHRLASGNGIRIAVIDSEVDASIPILPARSALISAPMAKKKNRTCMGPAWREPLLPARTCWG